MHVDPLLRTLPGSRRVSTAGNPVYLVRETREMARVHVHPRTYGGLYREALI